MDHCVTSTSVAVICAVLNRQDQFIIFVTSNQEQDFILSVFIYVLNPDSISECNLHTKILHNYKG
jgi:hypothetical protein